MYRCQRCERVVGPAVRAVERIVESRPRVYPERTYRIRGRRKPVIDPGGVGEEIARAIRVCPMCAEDDAPPGS